MKYDFGTLQAGLFLATDISHDSTIRYEVYVTTDGPVSTRLPVGRPKYLASIPRAENKVSSCPHYPDQILFGIKNDTAIEYILPHFDGGFSNLGRLRGPEQSILWWAAEP